MKDVAYVSDGFSPQVNIARMDGQRGVILAIYKTGDTSTLDVVSQIYAKLPQIKNLVPPQTVITPLFDQSIFVRAAIQGVLREGVVAACLTALMILLFLGSWRSTLIIAISIPLSILVSITILSALHETINLMTLGGLALAVGILVDDATVAIENIERNLAQGKDTIQRDSGRLAGNRHSGAGLDAVHLHRVRADVFPDGRGEIPVRPAGRSRGFRHARFVLSCRGRWCRRWPCTCSRDITARNTPPETIFSRARSADSRKGSTACAAAIARRWPSAWSARGCL